MRVDRTPGCKGVDSGFTLLELMVALAVFAIAALALERLEGLSLGQTADLDQRFLREVVAHNLVAEAQSDPLPPPVGVADGAVTNAGHRFAWQRSVARLDDGALLKVRFVVQDAAPGRGAPATTLEFIRRGDAP
ncbi:type II secretion system minor pseudopilin GspI [Novosphingobium sp. FKTRR1]|uniref:type II secretion system minor pseudopilin GspI n=1 Tax=Novosphingobium sp. FKTRR1 TaxID=2879118 RepID=UPI001CF0615F|nr:type II secretion system minor pseudopilin GspI [Novosphingobium sp. FKTRR1]